MQYNNPAGNEDAIIEDDGFSSEEEVEKEEILFEEVKDKKEDKLLKEEVKFKVPPPQEITHKSYSLHPDTVTGWAHKKELPVPIPLYFDNNHLDNLITLLLNEPKKKVSVCYLGPRYKNTYYAWHDKAFDFPYDHVKSENEIKFTDRPFCGQHWNSEDGLIFDSFFESGNLDCAVRVAEYEYDLFMRVDSNTRGHLQWFNFKIKNLAKLQKYKLNICNFQKQKLLYFRGSKPYIYSQKKYQKLKVEWEQAGESIRYERKHLATAKMYDYEMRAMQRLSFEYYSQYEQDEIQVAYCVPYTYTRLNQYIAKLAKKTQNRKFLSVSKLCTSLGGIEVPLLIIHDNVADVDKETAEVDGMDKKCVVVSGRAHPGESNGSHMLEGFIDYICGDTKEAQFLRKFVVFKIVPMLNPDGVVIGNYRTGLSGRDFNREYRNPQRQIFPQVHAFKKLVTENKILFKNNLLMFLDFHGHSTKKNTFFYGPEFPIIDKYYYQSRIFPKLLDSQTSMFRYYSCSFKISEFKVTTARAVLLRKINIQLSYTIETSNGSYFDYEKLKDVPYTEAKWKEMGRKIGSALQQYCQLIWGSQLIRREKAKNRNKNKSKQINIRRTSKSKLSPGKGPKVQSQGLVMGGMEDDRIKLLFEEIKKAQEEKELHLASDDDMSEGASDRQDDSDDLDKHKLDAIFDNIIRKKASREIRKRRICSGTTNEQNQQHFKTNAEGEQAAEEQEARETLNQKQDKPMNQSQQLFTRKHQKARGSILSAKVNVIKRENGKVPARVINFSFGAQVSPKKRGQSLEDRNRIFLPNKLDFSELVATKWSEKESTKDYGPLSLCREGGRVVDLSDQGFRKHFMSSTTSNLSKEKQTFKERQLKDSCQQTMFFNLQSIIPVNKKVQRFEGYKCRKVPTTVKGQF